MKRDIFIFLLIIGIGNFFTYGSEVLGKEKNTLEDFSSNGVYFEIGGQGLIFSLNYDYRFITNSTFRIGASFFLFGYGFPISLNFITDNNSSHHFEAGIGVMWLKASSLWGEAKSEFIPNCCLGYRYQPIKKSVLLRVSFTPFFNFKEERDRLGNQIKKLEIRPWGGFSVGLTF